MKIRFANNEERTVIIGATGSGKTVAAANQLSQRDFPTRPWAIFNTKGDKLLNAIPGIRELALHEIPKKPGLYMYRPIPEHDDERVNSLLWAIHKREKMGVYFDEGYSIPNCAGLNAILTQGRSKQIPVIMLSQRPVWLTRFVWSEADFVQSFRLSMEDDIKRMTNMLRVNFKSLPDYNSYYRDVKAKESVILRPCPNEDEILDVFDMRRIDRPRVVNL